MDRLEAIESIVSYQGRHSKWLNSVYVEATAEEVVALSELSFVKDIVPVSGHTYTTTSIIPIYDHGIAAEQADQITLVEGLHNLGYIGTDMVIAVLDAGFVGANTVDLTITSNHSYAELCGRRYQCLPRFFARFLRAKYHGCG